ncbi:type II toxin-antitoxin system RelE/ParE family toxin [Frankia sp. Mgl5]|uniref:type II toxin-antitoxin system RelE family toxin n=1 Tax=Frankia sp. Mgl5 TaxID=2933793 RepID=UPI002010183B|nr:type II toxin-antitoxin system RelE/ParE family toxin [Frankia sp. Mgl5]MCK9932039.1 type II toxin-antitoxin system RelE/ParE family toxin [Frankia sp. Mgl5]
MTDAVDRYVLQTSPAACHALNKSLPRTVAAAVYELVTGPLLDAPYRVGKRLIPPLDDRFSARRGTYRVIYRIDDKAMTVTVVAIDHHRDVYHR